MSRSFISIRLCLGCIVFTGISWAQEAPSGLLCDLLRWPEQVKLQQTVPEFSWVVPASVEGGRQGAYQIQVAETSVALEAGHGLTWDSGRVKAADSVAVPYAGPALEPQHNYFWRVRIWGERGKPGPFSELQHFRTGPRGAVGTATQPLVETVVHAVTHTVTPEGGVLVDFGRANFGYLTISAGKPLAGPLILRYGESVLGGRVNMDPGICIRAGTATLPAQDGAVVRVPFSDYVRPSNAVTIPGDRGVILPFRYVEVDATAPWFDADRLRMHALHYPFDDTESSFESSDEWLNRVWELSKHSIKATSYAGVYVDGDRERIPYEADAYINQLGHYYTDREFALARYTHEYLLDHPMWPTEWKFHSIFMAWADYQHTGSKASLVRNYSRLQTKLFLDRVDLQSGLFRSFPELKPERGNADIVDWPPEERVGFVFEEYNVVLHAFLYRALCLMERIAQVVDRPDDALRYHQLAATVWARVQQSFFDSAQGLYRDGINTTHVSFHANLFPLAFGLVTAEHRERIVEYLKRQGMVPSVYAAQYYLMALFEAREAETAIALMVADTDRSWRHMVEAGATITWEAWDKRYKDDLDWNHAWGAAPANLIPAYVLGVRPREAGFARILVNPQLGKLEHVEGRVPTIRGPVAVKVNQSKQRVIVKLDMPGNTRTDFVYPVTDEQVKSLLVNGVPRVPRFVSDWLEINELTPGKVDIIIELH